MSEPAAVSGREVVAVSQISNVAIEDVTGMVQSPDRWMRTGSSYSLCIARPSAATGVDESRERRAPASGEPMSGDRLTDLVGLS